MKASKKAEPIEVEDFDPNAEPSTQAESWNPQDRIKELRVELNKYGQAYFVENKSLISDEDYDALLRELKDLEALFPQMAAQDSPSVTVGAKSKRNNVTHRTQMLSLNNTYNTDEVATFDERIKKTLGINEPTYVCELKFDGGALSLHYKDGVLVRAVTRGDGAIGEDVTDNARLHIVDVPKKIDFQQLGLGNDFEVRGEFIVTKEEFERSNQALQESGARAAYSNPRNLACGIIGRIHADKHTPVKLNFKAYTLLSYNSPKPPDGQWESLQRLKQAGFTIDESHTKRVKGLPAVLQFIEAKNTERPNLPFEIDGVVVKLDSFSQQERMGFTSSAPRWAMAYKFSSKQAQTKLIDIKLQVGRTGKVTPVAIVDPVAIAGIVINRATLHNRQFIQQKKIKIGCMVTIERSADVIPKITARADLPPAPVADTAAAKKPATSGSKRSTKAEQEREIDENYDDGVDWSVCPCALKSPLVRMGKFDMCCTHGQCPEQLPRAIEHFLCREAVYIEALGPSRIVELVEKGFLGDFSDLFWLHQRREELENLERWGEKSVSVILDNIESAKKLSNLERVLYGLGVPSVGRETAILLAKQFKTMDRLAAASRAELGSIPTIGPKICDSVYYYFHPTGRTPFLSVIDVSKLTGGTTETGAETAALQSAVNGLILRLKEAGLNLNYSGYRSVSKQTSSRKTSGGAEVESDEPQESFDAPDEIPDNPAKGKTFVFTGKLTSMSRSAASDRVTKLGGSVKNAVVKGLDFLVLGNLEGEATTKKEAAEKKGVRILNEEQFVELTSRGN